MGTTLTGTTPQDTYDSLIKVTDNGPISGTAKFLSDGLGNDSVLALSTSRVGVGTNTPTHLLQVFAASAPELRLGDATTTIQMYTAADEAVLGTVGSHPFVFRTNATERMRILATGNVGIGTTPVLRLDVKGAAADTTTVGGITVEQSTLFRPSNDAGGLRFGFDASSNAYIYSSASGGILNLGTRTAPNNNINVSVTANGLTFNGDTAAANALDDYEEGTWTPTTISAGYTISSSSGLYTKIGRQVTIRANVTFSAVSAGSNSSVVIGANPFTPSAVFTGLCRENTTTGAVYVTSITTANVITINSMDGVTSGTQRTLAISESYIFTLTYFV